MNPRVSVIVPNYNHAQYLPERLDSILQQSFGDFELLLLDDASTDQSAEILAATAASEPRARFLPNQKNSGSPFAQWNRGAAEAKGEYLWIAESDDRAHPELLTTLVEMLDRDPSLGLAYAQSMQIDAQGAELYSYRENLAFIYPDSDWSRDFRIDGRVACRRWLVYHNPLPNASGILFRRSAYEAVGGAEEKMRLNGDWYLYVKLLLRYDLAFCARELNYFRVHRQSQRSRSRKNASVYQELLLINDLIRKEVPQSTAAADRALKKIGNWWIGNLPYHRWSSENRRINRQLYRRFNRVRGELPLRIALTFIISYTRDFLRFTGLLKPLKQFRAFLFPGRYWPK